MSDKKKNLTFFFKFFLTPDAAIKNPCQDLSTIEYTECCLIGLCQERPLQEEDIDSMDAVRG